FFELDTLVRVAHALALVRLSRAVVANVGRYLPNLLPIHALDDDLVLARRFDRDSRWNRILDRVREAERQVQLLALHGGAVADTDELELLLEALRHARDHVRQVRARRARHRVGEVAIRARGNLHEVAFDRDLDLGIGLERQAALLALDRDAPALALGGQVFAELDRLFTYSR